ncbi:MAG: hypothetical protein OSA40_09095 [Phycisphaerales bacterium]|nr:hypothetical protein [Phycisphaerales bacterium]
MSWIGFYRVANDGRSMADGEKIDRVLDLASVQLDLFSDLDDRHLRAARRLAGFKPAGDLLTAPGETGIHLG